MSSTLSVGLTTSTTRFGTTSQASVRGTRRCRGQRSYETKATSGRRFRCTVVRSKSISCTALPNWCCLAKVSRYIVRTEAIRISYARSEEHTSELQSLRHLVCRLLLEKKNI